MTIVCLLLEHKHHYFLVPTFWFSAWHKMVNKCLKRIEWTQPAPWITSLCACFELGGPRIYLYFKCHNIHGVTIIPHTGLLGQPFLLCIYLVGDIFTNRRNFSPCCHLPYQPPGSTPKNNPQVFYICRFAKSLSWVRVPFIYENPAEFSGGSLPRRPRWWVVPAHWTIHGIFHSK